MAFLKSQISAGPFMLSLRIEKLSVELLNTYLPKWSVKIIMTPRLTFGALEFWLLNLPQEKLLLVQPLIRRSIRGLLIMRFDFPWICLWRWGILLIIWPRSSQIEELMFKWLNSTSLFRCIGNKYLRNYNVSGEKRKCSWLWIGFGYWADFDLFDLGWFW